MGLLRLTLAVAVILSHSPIAEVWWRPLIGGELAVEMFFMISGFYMSLVLATKYRESDRSFALVRFWFARALRIYPAYWFVATVMLAYFVVVRADLFVHLKQLGIGFSLWAAISNVTLFGLDGLIFTKVTDAGVALVDALGRAPVPQPYHLLIIAPAWTLSLELMFYVMAPFLVRLNTSGLVSVFMASLVGRFITYQMGYAVDPWTYRFFPFELALFVAGLLAHRVYAARIFWQSWPPIALALLMLTFPFIPEIKVLGFSAVGTLLLIVGWLALPSVFARRRDSVIDRAIGEVSYPVYIVHLPVIIMLSRHLSVPNHPYLFTALAIALSISVGAGLGIFLDQFVNHRLTKAFMRFQATTPRVDGQTGLGQCSPTADGGNAQLLAPRVNS